MKRIGSLVALCISIAVAGCVVDTESESGDVENVDSAEELLTARDFCMRDCGYLFDSCRKGGGSVEKCSTEEDACMQKCETRFPTGSPSPQDHYDWGL